MLREIVREFFSGIILKIFSRLSKEDKTWKRLAGKNKIILASIAIAMNQNPLVFTEDLEPISVTVV